MQLSELQDKQTAVTVRETKDKIAAAITSHRATLLAMIPKNVNLDKLTSSAQAAVNANPKLRECTIASILGGVVKSVQLGLELNTPLHHAVLVPYWNEKLRSNEAQLQIEYQGYISLARRSGEMAACYAHEVRENDHFDYNYGFPLKLDHRPARTDRGAITDFYAVVQYRDGTYDFEVMSSDEVNYIRDKYANERSKAWKEEPARMGCKTVMRRLLRRVPMSAELALAVALDDRADLGRSQSLNTVISGSFNVVEGADDQDSTDEQGSGDPVVDREKDAGAKSPSAPTVTRRRGRPPKPGQEVDPSAQSQPTQAPTASGSNDQGNDQSGDAGGNTAITNVDRTGEAQAPLMPPLQEAKEPETTIERLRRIKDVRILDDEMDQVRGLNWPALDLATVLTAYHNRRDILVAIEDEREELKL